jgi:hypothetical protein
MNGKLREARSLSEKLGAVILMAIQKNEERNRRARASGREIEHILGAKDFTDIVTPFVELAITQAQLAVLDPRGASNIKGLLEKEAEYSSKISEIVERLES